MKKLISLTLAIIVILSLAVPAMAATVSGTDETSKPTGTTTVTTTITPSYTVTIPGEQTLTALSTADLNIGAVSVANVHLSAGKCVQYSTGATGNFVLADANSFEYELTNNEAKLLHGNTDSATGSDMILTVSEAEWKKADVGTYTATLTFTISVVSET